MKNKYKFIRNKYITESAEYISLINLVIKFYNFTSLDEYVLNTLQVVFNNLLELFNFYPNNIIFQIIQVLIKLCYYIKFIKFLLIVLII